VAIGEYRVANYNTGCVEKDTSRGDPITHVSAGFLLTRLTRLSHISSTSRYQNAGIILSTFSHSLFLMTAITSPISLSRPDLSMCQHLKQLVSLPSTAIESVQIKQEPGTEEGKSVASSSTGGQQDIHPPASSQSASIRQRYANIIRWGAREEGAKRRRVSSPSWVLN